MLLNFKKKALTGAVSTLSGSEAPTAVSVEQVKQQISDKILGQEHKLEMIFTLEGSKKALTQFFIENNLDANKAGVFIPEGVVIKAHNYDDLIIALKMQQVSCENWFIGVDTHCYDYEKDHVLTIPLQVIIDGMDYLEIYKPMPVYVDRGNNLKTRWKGLEDELNDAYAEYNHLGDYHIIRTDIRIVGNCRFLSVPLYEEFRFMQKMRDAGKLGAVFEIVQADLKKKGLIDHKQQPIKGNETALPNLVNYFLDIDDPQIINAVEKLVS